MKLRVTHYRILWAIAVCAVLVSGILFYSMSAPSLKSHHGTVKTAPVGEAFPSKIQEKTPAPEKQKEIISETPAKTEEEIAPPVETPQPPAPVVETPKPEQPAPVVETPKPAPVIKTPKSAPVAKTPAPQPAPVVVEPPKLQPPVIAEAPKPPPPVIVEAPKPPPAPVEQEAESSSVLSSGFHSYFINREVRSNNIGMFPRWTGMLSRYSAEAHTLDSVCGSQQHTPCKLKDWKDFLEGLRGDSLLDQLDEVNRFLNKYPYIDDIVNWGFDNYWETPYEFQRKSGNCKDYAIAKFMSLRALGVPDDIMRVVVLKDLNLGGVIHAVLVVSVGEKSYMLDNQIKQVVTTDKVYHYVPIYSINEEHWWQHFMTE
jgi:predicted transglutaminase-like cysteine proteinase